jgi:hypothetical protein
MAERRRNRREDIDGDRLMGEDEMIRRNIRHVERDPRAVKWSLVAAALALAIGGYAEMVMSAGEPVAEPAPAVAESVEEAAMRVAG